MSAKVAKIVVLISGGGSNLQSLIDSADGEYEIVAVISNQSSAYGLQRAEKAGIHNETVDHTKFSCREEFDENLQQQIDSFNPDLVLLAGFMRILTDGFVDHYAGRMLNIHPSLLPKFKGLRTHKRALEAGETEHGATVHFVTSELDSGKIVKQAKVAVEKCDSEQELAVRVLQQEHKLYPAAVKLVIENM